MADSNVVIGASLKLDTSQVVTSTKSVAELKASIKDLTKQFENAKAGSAEQKKAYKELTDTQAQLKASTDNLNQSNKDATGHFANLKEGLGKVNPALSGASEGVNKLSATFKALLANPVVLVITAIVGALTLLYKAFTNTFEGAEKVEQIFAGVKAAAQALFDNLGRVASAIVKFFSFDFSGAVDEIKGVVSSVENAFSAMSKLTKQAQELHREQLQNDLESAERAKKLAILREQSTDEDVPLAKRKAALKELQAEAEKNAREDIDLAKRTADNKIAQLTLEKDGALKNQDEINKIKIEQINGETENANELRRINKQVTAAEKQELAERKEAAQKAAAEAKQRRQELVEFTNKLTKLQQDNELTIIASAHATERAELESSINAEKKLREDDFNAGKISRAQYADLISSIDKKAFAARQELQKKQSDQAEELAKGAFLREQERLEKRILADKAAIELEFNENAITKERFDELSKQADEKAAIERKELAEKHSNDIRLLTNDSYQKDLKALQNKLAEEKRANDLAFQDRKITRQQENQLNAELDKQAALAKQALDEKYNKEIADKEAAFQKELAALRSKITIDGIKDSRELERVQLNIGYEEKLQDAINRYKDDAVKFQQIKNALDEQLKADQKKLDEKNLKEDKKKGFDSSDKDNTKIINDPKKLLDDRKAALDAENQLIKDAFDQKIITEEEYNAKVDALSQARIAIRDQEKQHNALVANSIAGALGTLSDIAGKQTALGKTLAIASTTISTYQSAIGAFKGMVTTIPGPVGIALGAVAAAGAIATGLAAVKKIISVKIPKGDSGGAAPAGLPAVSAPVAPTQAGVKLDQSSIDKVGDATAGRTYVLDADVANNRERNERLNRASRLGG